VTQPDADLRCTTGLLDRWSWHVRAAEALAAAGNRASALLLIDLDNVPLLAAVHGDPAGDAVLQAAASILTDALRATDIAGHGGHGGDEFLVLLPARDRQLGELIARRIRARIRRAIIPTLSAHGEPIIITDVRASIGVAIHDPSTARTLTLDDLLRQADAALLAARNHGGDQTIVAGTRTARQPA
jgi:diguanylate cyclase (GGDEF)-like protein